MGSCLGCAYSCCCCQCNLMIFPSPKPSYNKNNSSLQFFCNSSGDFVPYMKIPSQKNHNHKEVTQINVIYFHGNAEDIGYSSNFLFPIYNYYEQKSKTYSLFGKSKTKISITLYAIEYPTYGSYKKAFPARISDRIKSDSLQFFNHLQQKQRLTIMNTVVIGRSIGSGGACYLASRKKINNLVLISPFSTIPKVARDFVGCIGELILKMHFNNLEQIQQYQGNLLVIHGKADEVINYKHGQMVVNFYQLNNGKKCVFVSPNNMSHNYFDYQVDILQPITKLISQAAKK